MKKLFITSDKNKKSESIKTKILKFIKNTNVKNCEIIIVIGGDGFMLQILKKFYKFKKPFYGINSGDYGFLMNKFNEKNLLKNISKTDLIKISPLQMYVKNKKGTSKNAIAINEISILRQSRQVTSISIKNGSKDIIKKLRGDGLLVCTPAGSTAYNLSVSGPILPLYSKKLAITPISPFRPRRWKGKIVPSSSLIKITNLDIKKRSLSVVADNIEVRNIKSVKIKISNSIKFKLLYDRNNSLIKKIKLEQLRKK